MKKYSASKPVLTGMGIVGIIGAVLAVPVGALVGGVLGGFLGLGATQKK